MLIITNPSSFNSRTLLSQQLLDYFALSITMMLSLQYTAQPLWLPPPSRSLLYRVVPVLTKYFTNKCLFSVLCSASIFVFYIHFTTQTTTTFTLKLLYLNKDKSQVLKPTAIVWTSSELLPGEPPVSSQNISGTLLSKVFEFGWWRPPKGTVT